MEKLKNEISQIVTEKDLYLYDVIYQKENNDYILRVMLDSKKGITIDDCQAVSVEVSKLLDELDPFKDPYFLEVTSAGAEHELRNDEEIKMALGKSVFIKTMEQSFEGTLIKYKDGMLHLNVKKDIFKINIVDVEKIRLAISL